MAARVRARRGLVGLAAGLLLLLGVGVGGQQRVQEGPANLTANGATTCTATTTGCVVLTTAGFSGVSVQLGGTFTGTFNFEACSVSCSTAANWIAVSLTPVGSTTPATAATAAGMWNGSLVAAFFRVRASGSPTGTASVVLLANTTLARGGGGGGTVGNALTIASPLSGGSFDGSAPVTLGCATCAVMGGSDTQVLYNDGGAIGGNAGLAWNKSRLAFTVDGTAGTSGGGDYTAAFYRYNATGGGQVIYAEGDLADPAAGQFYGMVIDVGNGNGATLPLLNAVKIGGNYAFGAGSAVTTNIGLDIGDETAGATNYAIRTGLGIVSLGDSLQLATGAALRTDTTTAHTALLQAYDVDGTAYKTFATLTNGNTPSFALTQPAGGSLTINGLTYPTADGSATYVLTTDGAGTLSFQPTVSSTTTIINNIKFSNGKGLTTDIHTNDTLPFQAFDTDDAVYRTFATLTAGATPNFDLASPTGGTLSLTLGSDATGDLYYRNSSGKVARLAIGSSTNVLTVSGGLPSWAAAASGAVLSAITAAAGANTIASGNNVQTWNWANTTAASQSMIFGETTAATNGGAAATTTQAILSAKTLASSTALPFYILNAGGAPSLRIDDVASDTTPVCVDSGGFLGVGTCAPVDLLTVVGTGGYEFEINDGTRRYGIYVDATIGGIGSISSHPFSIFTANSQPRVKVLVTGVTQLYRQANPPTSIGTGTTGLTNEYLHLGGSEAITNGYYLIGFGYSSDATVPPAFVGFQEISNTANTYGDLVFGTRSVTTDTAPTERMRIVNDGGVLIADLKTTGAANGKTVVCVDTTTGKLYASTSGVACAN